MTLDPTMAMALANNLIRCGGRLLKRETRDDGRALAEIASTLAEAQQVLEKACGRVVLAKPKGEASGTSGPCPAVIDDEVA